MNAREARSRRYLADLFAGPFPGHAIIMDPEPVPNELGDLTAPGRPVRDWAPYVEQVYESRVRWAEALDDDSVPVAPLPTHTGLFAAAFGCPIHDFDGSNPAALSIVETAEEADALPQPSLDAPSLSRVLELGLLVRDRLGPHVPIGVPDIQSPFDIAGLVWRKEEMFVAMKRSPDAVQRLVAKCHTLLKGFLLEFVRLFPECSLVHCPYAWAPPSLGCSLSEDEAGALSAPMFDEFCLPSLVDLSEAFGGLFVHCCANADHQHAGLLQVPNLRAVNRVFTRGPLRSIADFSGRAALMVAWSDEATVTDLLDLSVADTRWLLNMPYQPLDDARRTYERLRARCRRR